MCLFAAPTIVLRLLNSRRFVLGFLDLVSARDAKLRILGGRQSAIRAACSSRAFVGVGFLVSLSACSVGSKPQSIRSTEFKTQDRAVFDSMLSRWQHPTHKGHLIFVGMPTAHFFREVEHAHLSLDVQGHQYLGVLGSEVWVEEIPQSRTRVMVLGVDKETRLEVVLEDGVVCDISAVMFE